MYARYYVDSDDCPLQIFNSAVAAKEAVRAIARAKDRSLYDITVAKVYDKTTENFIGYCVSYKVVYTIMKEAY